MKKKESRVQQEHLKRTEERNTYSPLLDTWTVLEIHYKIHYGLACSIFKDSSV